MRRFLLFVAAAVLAVSASAQGLATFKQNEKAKNFKTVSAKQPKVKKAPRKATEERTIVEIPETAEMSLWSGEYLVSTMFGWGLNSGVTTKVFTEGTDFYVEDFFHSMYYMPVKGSVDAKGNLVFKKQKVYEGIDYNGDGSEYVDLYFTLIEVDEEGEATFPDDDIVLKPTADGGYTLGGTEEEPVYYGLCDQFGYYWALCANLTITPFTPSSSAVELPAGAETKKTVYKHFFKSFGEEYNATNLAATYQDGDTLYLNNLCPDSEGWLKGTVKDGKLVVPTGQFLGANGDYLLEFKAGKDYTYKFEWTDEDNWEYEETQDYSPADELTFTNVDGKWVLDAGLCVVETMADGSAFGVYYGEEVKLYPGDKPATPADPTVTLEDYTDMLGCWVLTASIPAEDNEGEYIRPENMEISLWEDGEMLTLSGDDGYYLSEDVTWMPFGWTDDAGGYDLAFTTMTPSFYLYEDLFEEIGLQVRYTVDGVTKYSNVVYMDKEGNTRKDTGIKGITETVAVKSDSRIFDLAGQHVGKTFRGICIQNGRKAVK